MEFQFDTIYGVKAVTVMSKSLRKTLRREKTIKSNILNILLAVLSAALPFLPPGREFVWDFISVTSFIFAFLLLSMVFFYDIINGVTAQYTVDERLKRNVTVFYDCWYTSTTEYETKQWMYGNHCITAEMGDYFVFIFDKYTAYVYDKRTLTGGTEEEFRKLIIEKTGREIVKL